MPVGVGPVLSGRVRDRAPGAGRRVRVAAARHGRARSRFPPRFAQPGTTALGKQVDARAKAHPGLSGFLLLTDGAASFVLHQEIAARATRTLDVQYFLVQQDETGKLLLAALLEAADRGVHVRLLIDDAQAFDAGSAIRPLAAHPNIEIRIFNPFVVRRELTVLPLGRVHRGQPAGSTTGCTTSSSSATTRSP